MINVILAHNNNLGIGLNGKLPWKCKEELQYFKDVTMNSVLIIGRKTVENLPHLEGRVILCLSSTGVLNTDKNNTKVLNTLENCIDYAKTNFKDRKIFVAGGESIYKMVLTKYLHLVQKIYLSIIKDNTICDTYFNIYDYLSDWNIISSHKMENFVGYILQRENKEEEKYVNLLEEVLEKGEERKGRNGITKSLFFKNLSFDLRKGFPLLTTKKMFLRGIFEELMFFIRGETDTKKLEENGVNIWKGNTNKEFLEKIGKGTRREGLMGPMYGYQWRHYNAIYDEETGKPLEKGIDQLRNVIAEIKTNPTSRRILMTDFNPLQTEEGVLFPCHSLILQFYVSEKYLDMSCYNRSQDLFLGVPFNIASSSLLLTLISKITNLIPRFLHMTLGDVHIYEQHYDSVNLQLNRVPYSFPSLIIDKEINSVEELEILSFENIKLIGYDYYPVIKAEMIA